VASAAARPVTGGDGGASPSQITRAWNSVVEPASIGSAPSAGIHMTIRSAAVSFYRVATIDERL
jgi:hypothetical protein